MCAAAITYGSVCSGMEAATLAWRPLGWRCAFVAEHDPDVKSAGLQPAQSLLQQRLPNVPNLGDMTLWSDWSPDLIASIDVLIGGTPCQGFSFAGARGSLGDERSNLCLEFIRLADAADALRAERGRQPIAIVWENVPGVLSTDDNAFGCFLGGLVGAAAALVPAREQRWTNAGVVDGPGRSAAWRTLDAQFFGLAQRRSRVFVVASARGLDPVEILFEPARVQGNPTPRRRPRSEITPPIAGCSNHGGANGPGRTPDDAEALIVTTGALGASDGGLDDNDARDGRLVVTSGLEPVAFTCKDHGQDAGELAPTLRAMGHTASHANGGGQVAVAFALRGRADGAQLEICGDGDTAGALRAAEGGSSRDYVASSATAGSAPFLVRRLTPRECERLQGAEDDWTLVFHRGKLLADSPRYRMLGNTFAVNVVRWIGERIEAAVGALPSSSAP